MQISENFLLIHYSLPFVLFILSFSLWQVSLKKKKALVVLREQMTRTQCLLISAFSFLSCVWLVGVNNFCSVKVNSYGPEILGEKKKQNRLSMLHLIQPENMGIYSIEIQCLKYLYHLLCSFRYRKYMKKELYSRNSFAISYSVGALRV